MGGVFVCPFGFCVFFRFRSVLWVFKRAQSCLCVVFVCVSLGEGWVVGIQRVLDVTLCLF